MGFKEALARNLRQPTGLFGKWVGLIMNKGNDFMNRFAVKLLNAQPGDRILEIGFGNGKYLHEIAAQMKTGLVAGVDFSPTMVKQARGRSRSLITQGLMEIKLGEVNRIPYDSESFDKVFTVNTIYFWPNPANDIREIHRVLRPGGTLIICFRSKQSMEIKPFTQHGFTLYEPEQVMDLLMNAGFADVRKDNARQEQQDVYCVIASKS